MSRKQMRDKKFCHLNFFDTIYFQCLIVIILGMVTQRIRDLKMEQTLRNLS